MKRGPFTTRLAPSEESYVIRFPGLGLEHMIGIQAQMYHFSPNIQAFS